MADRVKLREIRRVARHQRIRKTVQGTVERPRLCVHRSLKNLYAQIVNDVESKVLCGVSTLNKDVRTKVKYGGNIAAANSLGKAVAEKAQAQGIKKVCFDRGGYRFHGRVKAFVEGAREGGLEF